MIKVVDIVYHCHTEYRSPGDVLQKHQPTLGFIPYVKDYVDYTVIRHLAYEGFERINGVQYAFFSRPNKKWQIPLKTHGYVKSMDPDIVLVHGFVFPLQVMALRMLLGKKCAIVLVHHAEQPSRSLQRMFQMIADPCISSYLFSAQEIAAPWLAHKVIRDTAKVKLIMAASVKTAEKNKTCCKTRLGLTGVQNFLWVGRLNQNKDPLTVLRAFGEKVRREPCAMLYMIYQTAELLLQIQTLIVTLHLQNNVILCGKLPGEDVSTWFHAADYFISASHAEAAGYALLEAMSAGCIPIVTKIPSYQHILQHSPAYFFQAGNAEELSQILVAVGSADSARLSAEVKNSFVQHVSFEKLAEKMLQLFTDLHSIKR